MPKKSDDGPRNGGEVDQPDFETAARILKRDVRPAEEKVGEWAQTMGEAFKAIKKLNVDTKAARSAFWLSKQSDEKRDAYLRSLRGMLAALNIGITRDMVDEAEDAEETPIIPTVERVLPTLATVQ